MTLYFLKGSSGYIKIGRTSNFDKRLSEIRRATTDEHVEVLAVFHGDDDFVIRDRKTDAATTIRYTDVARIERNKGHSLARNMLIGVGIGAGAVVGAILIIIARAD